MGGKEVAPTSFMQQRRSSAGSGSSLGPSRVEMLGSRMWRARENASRRYCNGLGVDLRLYISPKPGCHHANFAGPALRRSTRMPSGPHLELLSSNGAVHQVGSSGGSAGTLEPFPGVGS